MMYYKKKKTAFGICSAIIILVFLVFEFFPQIETKESNNAVSFSKEAGFYEEEFFLELSSTGGTIYYTLDGTIPNKNSIQYEKPIRINDASKNENNHSMRTDLTTGFDLDEIRRINLEKEPGYKTPDYKIDKATIIRAVSYDDMGNCSEVSTATYFVGYSEKNGYEGMNVLSIVTDPDNLFDYEKGIYVTGKEYENYEKTYRNTGEWYWREEFWALWGANYRGRGAKWERKAFCQFFDTEGNLELSQDCGIRIHGGISRGYLPRSLNIYARKKYDGNKKFQADIFETGYYPSAVVLFQGGNDYSTKARDYLIASEIKDLKVSSMNYKPYVMFLNGEYWGVYWLNEKYDKDYVEYYYGVNSDNVLLFKDGELIEGEEEDKKYYYEMLRFCSESDLTDSKNFEKVCSLIDIESCVDYYALMIYLGRRGDWPSANYALWRAKKEENGDFGDGKWRWMVYDLNSDGFLNTFEPIEYVMDNDKLFKNLMTNNKFREMFLTQMEEMIDLFEYEKMKIRIEEYKEFMSQNMKKNDKRFFGDDSGENFDNGMDTIELFFKERKEYLIPVLQQYK